jgi:transcriptional regulator with XRE-family HTH domain
MKNTETAAWSATILARSIQRVRRRRGWTQAELAQRCGWTQPMIARMESPANRQWTFTSLIRLAQVLRARLRVRFIPVRSAEARDTRTA